MPLPAGSFVWAMYLLSVGDKVKRAAWRRNLWIYGRGTSLQVTKEYWPSGWTGPYTATPEDQAATDWEVDP
jgi:hypothetical protein